MIPLLAFALLQFPMPEPIAAPPKPEYVNPRGHLAALQALAMDLEILDARECRYVLAEPESLWTDGTMLLRRWWELRDAPPLADHWRFPDRTVINELLSFNRSCRSHLDVLGAVHLHKAGLCFQVQGELDRLYEVWDTARDTRTEYYYVTIRRHKLKQLRELIGDDAYYAGRLPCHVPIHRFAELR